MEKILVLCDDIWHPAEVIEKGIQSLDCLYRFEFVKAAKDILTPEMIANYPLIINCKMNNVTGGNPAPWFENSVTEVMGKEFQEYVEQGGAFLSIHAGNGFFGEGDGIDEYTRFVGNRFVSHPLRCKVILQKVKNHPIMTEVDARFAIRDEHYEIELLGDDMDVFLTSHSETGGSQPAGYTKTLGKGRICVLTPGHTLSTWQNSEFQKLVINSIEWCLKK